VARHGALPWQTPLAHGGETGLTIRTLKISRSVLSRLGRRAEPPSISWLLQVALSRPKLISLAAGFTDHESLPVEDVRALLNGILRSARSGRPALQYGSTQGDPVLRRLTGERVRCLDGGAGAKRAYSSDQMIIANGSQQLLYMVSEALCDEGDIVLVEDPTYFVYLGIMQARGLRARAVRMENDGLNLRRLESVLESLKQSGELRRVKLLYLVSYFQNPTGSTTSFEKKSGVLELLAGFERAAGHPIYLLEDAAYRELRFRGQDVRSSLAVKGRADRVIYTGTYSKPFATGTRVGFGILPEPIFAAVLRIKGNHDFGTSNLLQQLLARALASGRYEKHLHRLRKRYAQKAQVMLQALREGFPAGIDWQEPEGGLYFWARLPGSFRSGRTSKLFQAALAQDVLYVPGGLCYADDPTRPKPDHEMRLSFGSATERDMREGIERLGTVLRALMR
jgi:2-aminoadipate transaminase